MKLILLMFTALIISSQSFAGGGGGGDRPGMGLMTINLNLSTDLSEQLNSSESLLNTTLNSEVSYQELLNTSLNTSGEILVCDVKDQAREEAGLPLSIFTVNLTNQVTMLYKYDQTNVALVTLDKVSSSIPTVRSTCQLTTRNSEEAGNGLYNFKCGMVTVSFQYDLKVGSGFYGEKFNNVTKAFAVKNCRIQ